MPASTTFDAAGFERGDDLVEVGAGVLDAQAAEAVVAAELDDDDCGLQGEDVVEALDAVFGGVAADAFVDDAVVVAAGVEIGLEIVGIALAGIGSVAGGEAVAEADEQRASVWFSSWRAAGGFGLRLGDWVLNRTCRMDWLRRIVVLSCIRTLPDRHDPLL